jgi:hypothetical protein
MLHSDIPTRQEFSENGETLATINVIISYKRIDKGNSYLALFLPASRLSGRCSSNLYVNLSIINYNYRNIKGKVNSGKMA